VIKANIDSPEVDPENAKLARARREAAFMGKKKARGTSSSRSEKS
jgi:hypothetical protein